MFRLSQCCAAGLGAIFTVGLSFPTLAALDKGARQVTLDARFCSEAGEGYHYRKIDITCVKPGEPAKPAECRVWDAVCQAALTEHGTRGLLQPNRSRTLQEPHLAVGMGDTAIIKISLEAGWVGARNGFEDSNFNSSGFIGGGSAQINFPINNVIFAGLGASILGSNIAGSPSDWSIKSSIPFMAPIDAIVGVTVAPSAFQHPVSFYGFGGFVIANVKESLPPFSDTETMTGWSIGAGIEVPLTSTVSAGVKFRHFELGAEYFSVFPGTTSRVSERVDMVTGTLSWRLPLTY